MRKYKYRKYKDNYPVIFEKEKFKLKKILPKSKIEHIGSTAVRGLGGKGIIDIIICVPKKEMNNSKDKLIEKGYKYKEKAGSKQRLFFERDYGFLIKKRVHIHLTYKNSKILEDSICFRNRLRNNKSLKEKYEKIKKESVKKGLKGKKYREYKRDFIKKRIK